MSTIYDFYKEVFKDLGKVNQSTMEELASGKAQDFAEYQWNVGYMQGIEYARRYMEDQYQKMMRNYEENE